MLDARSESYDLHVRNCYIMVKGAGIKVTAKHIYMHTSVYTTTVRPTHHVVRQ